MAIADQTLAAVAGRETFRRAELFDRIGASENGIDIALAKLVEAGRLVRTAPHREAA